MAYVLTHATVLDGTEQMEHLARWYMAMAAKKTPVGFFQIGGGIAGDFPICVVPMLIQDMEREDTPFWAYFAQPSMYPWLLASWLADYALTLSIACLGLWMATLPRSSRQILRPREAEI